MLTRKRIRRGSFHSLVDIANRHQAIPRQAYNAEPKPFVWKASAPSILAKLNLTARESFRIGQNTSVMVPKSATV